MQTFRAFNSDRKPLGSPVRGIRPHSILLPVTNSIADPVAHSFLQLRRRNIIGDDSASYARTASEAKDYQQSRPKREE